MTSDLQAEINAKEKVQEQLNIIYANAQILSGDVSMYTSEYVSKLQTDIDNAWSNCCQIANSMLQFKGLSMPKTLDVTALTSAGIITEQGN